MRPGTQKLCVPGRPTKKLDTRYFTQPVSFWRCYHLLTSKYGLIYLSKGDVRDCFVRGACGCAGVLIRFSREEVEEHNNTKRTPQSITNQTWFGNINEGMSPT